MNLTPGDRAKRQPIPCIVTESGKYQSKELASEGTTSLCEGFVGAGESRKPCVVLEHYIARPMTDNSVMFECSRAFSQHAAL